MSSKVFVEFRQLKSCEIRDELHILANKAWVQLKRLKLNWNNVQGRNLLISSKRVLHQKSVS